MNHSYCVSSFKILNKNKLEEIDIILSLLKILWIKTSQLKPIHYEILGVQTHLSKILKTVCV